MVGLVVDHLDVALLVVVQRAEPGRETRQPDHSLLPDRCIRNNIASRRQRYIRGPAGEPGATAPALGRGRGRRARAPGASWATVPTVMAVAWAITSWTSGALGSTQRRSVTPAWARAMTRSWQCSGSRTRPPGRAGPGRRRPARRPSGPRPRPPSGRSTPAAGPPPRGWPGRGRPGRTPPAGPGLLGHPVDVGGGHQHVVDRPGQPGQPLAPRSGSPTSTARVGLGWPRSPNPARSRSMKPGVAQQGQLQAVGGELSRAGSGSPPARMRAQPGPGHLRGQAAAGQRDRRGRGACPSRSCRSWRGRTSAPPRPGARPGSGVDAEAHQTSGWASVGWKAAMGQIVAIEVAVAGDLAARVLPPAA